MSEAIGDTEYNPQTEELTILFADGSMYTYMRVPLMVFAAFQAAGSKGQFFNASIRDVYPFTRG